MKEWQEENRLNSFNCWDKGLTYYDYYIRINEWRLKKVDKPYPPLEISIDLYARCQCQCKFCNFGKYFDADIGNRKMPDKHIVDLLKFFSEWEIDGHRTVSACYGGGGEPTLHPFLPEALFLSNQLGIKPSIATNGINFYDKLIEASAQTCRWIGFSVDAATEETYVKLKQVNKFKQVLKNIEKVVKKVRDNNCNNDISYKFLIFDFNQHEIFEACKIAKDLGVKDFYARVADFGHQGVKEKIANPYNVELIKEQFEKCHQKETKNFRVFTSVHKFNPDFTPKRNFSQCYAAPLNLQINPNYNLFFCVDTRNLEFYKLGEHYDVSNIAKIWGGEKHYNLTFRDGCKNCKSRCTWTIYNYLCEKLAIENKDPLCRDFT